MLNFNESTGARWGGRWTARQQHGGCSAAAALRSARREVSRSQVGAMAKKITQERCKETKEASGATAALFLLCDWAPKTRTLIKALNFEFPSYPQRCFVET